MLHLAARTWKLSLQATLALPEAFLSAGVLACALLAGQYWLPALLGITPSPVQLALLAIGAALLRAVFVGPLAWAVQRWVLLREANNDIALPRQRGQRDMVGWVAGMSLLGCLPALMQAALARDGTLTLPAASAGAAATLAVFIVMLRLALAAPAMVLDVTAPVPAGWRASRAHAWFAAASFALAFAPLAGLGALALLAWQATGSLAGLAAGALCVMAAPVVTSTWQACLYARLRCEGAVPDDLPPPAEEPSLLAAALHSGRAAALAARRMPVLLLAVLALLAGSYWLVLNFYIRQHLDMGRTGSWLEDFGWRGTAWLVFVLAQQYVAAAYGAAAVMAAAQRAVLRGQPGGLAALLPSRGVLWMTLLLLPIVCGPILAGAAAVALGVLRALLGPVSFFLTEVLLAPVAALCVVALLRLLLITVPLALGRRFAAAESWRLSRGHVWLVVAVYATTLLPLAALLAVLADWLPAGPAMENFVRVPLGIVLNALLAGGAAAVLYRRLQTGPAEEERPSRNPFRRREPALSDLHLADLTAGGYKHD